MSPGHVAVVGGGFSGTLQAIQLLRRGIGRVSLIERTDRLARGAAYGTRHPEHLLNVRANAMSALPDAPTHFAHWFAGHGGAPTDFAERRLYGAYVEELLREAKRNAGERLQLISDEVTAIDAAASGELLRFKSGSGLAADVVILAIGNLPPDTPPAVASAGLGPGVYLDDPWSGDFVDSLRSDESVLLIGTGLTAVDAALMLEAGGFGGTILALSRRGLLPRAHAEAGAPPALGTELAPRCSRLLLAVREHAKSIGWRSAVDQLRPVTQALWAKADIAERRRFLRHLRPWWDVHRHRIAPSIADRIQHMRDRGCLSVAAGKIARVRGEGGGAVVAWRERGGTADRETRVRRIVNCTGPQADIRRAGEPLLDRLLAEGRIRPDSCRIGIDVDPAGRAIDADGAASATLHAVGPMTRGALWEIVAVPDIRIQVAALARRIADGHGQG